MWNINFKLVMLVLIEFYCTSPDTPFPFHIRITADLSNVVTVRFNRYPVKILIGDWLAKLHEARSFFNTLYIFHLIKKFPAFIKLKVHWCSFTVPLSRRYPKKQSSNITACDVVTFLISYLCQLLQFLL